MMKKSLQFLSLSLLSLGAFKGFAQSEGTAISSVGRGGVATTLATDYQSIGINPANLALKSEYEGHRATMGFAEVGFSAFSDALKRKDLWDALLNNSGDFSYAQKREAAKAFADKALYTSADVMVFGFAYQKEKFGGIAFSIRDRFNWYSFYNSQTADLLFNGRNSSYFQTLTLSNNTTRNNDASLSDADRDKAISGQTNAPSSISSILNGTKVTMNWYREFNLSYGNVLLKKENFELLGGLGLKYIQAIAYTNSAATPGNINSQGAFSPGLGIDFGKAALNNPSAVPANKSGLPSSVGTGYGLDLGLTLVVKEKTRIGVAVNNIGQVDYTVNVYNAKDTLLGSMTSNGAGSYNFLDAAKGFNADNGTVKWKGSSSMTQMLPTQFRVGGSHTLMDDNLTLAFDAVVPLNNVAGNLVNPLFGLGADLKLEKWIKISSGFTQGGFYATNYVNVPLGVTITAGEKGTWEFSIATRDIMTYIYKNRPNISFAMAALRFRL